MCRSLFFLLVCGAMVFLFTGLGKAAPGATTDSSVLRVLSTMPTGQVERLTHITVTFSEAMRPLGAMEQDAASSPLQLTVPGSQLPSGTYRWLDPATLSYLFDKPVALPVRIKARIPKGAKALSGTLLDAETAWTVSTPPLDLAISDEAPLPPTGGSVILTSNYALDVDVLRSKLSAQMDRTMLALNIDQLETPVYGRGMQTVWRYRITFESPVTVDKTVSLKLAPGFTAKGAHEGLGEKLWTFKTFPALSFLKWSTRFGEDSAHKAISPEDRLVVHFSNPVRFGDVQDAITISPQPAPFPPDRFAAGEPFPYRSASSTSEGQRERISNNFALAFIWDTRTTYTVTIAETLTDTYGQKLGKKQSFTFKTGDFLPVFFMKTQRVLMERAQGGLFPLTVRNVPRATVRLRYIENDNLTLRSNSMSRQNLSSAEFKKYPNAVERLVELDFSKQMNTHIVHQLNIPELLGFSGPEQLKDLVEITVTIPALHADAKPKETQQFQALVQISDIGITYKEGAENGLAWFTSLETGKPLPGVKVQLVDKNLKTLWEGTADDQGLAQLPGSKALGSPVQYLLARYGDDANATASTDDAFHYPPTPGALSVAEENRQWQGHMISQSPLYQPGQTVNFTLYTQLFTDTDGASVLDYGRWMPVQHTPISIAIYDSRSKAVFQETLTSNGYGSLEGRFTLPDDANLGQYSVRLASARFKNQAYASGFVVAAFRQPEFKVDLAVPEARPALLRDEAALSGTLTSAYFSGAALKKAQISLSVTQRDAHFQPGLLRGYKTGPNVLYYRAMPALSPFPHTTLSVLSGETDAQGNWAFVVPSLVGALEGPQKIQCEASVTDASELVSQGVASTLIHPSSLYVGLRCPFIAVTGSDTSIELKAATWENKPVKAATVRLSAYRNTEQETARPQTGRQAPAQQQAEWEKTIKLSKAEGQTERIRFEKSGSYTLRAAITDEQGRTSVSSTTVHVPGQDMRWNTSFSMNLFEVLADKEGYVEGETAQLLLKNPFPKGLALITLERKGVLSHFTQEVSGPSPTVSIPLGEKERPYVHASVVIVRGRPDPAGEEKNAYARRAAYGSVLLTVARKNPASLHVSLKTDTGVYRPGETVQVAMQTSDEQNKGKKTQITLLAVDERVLRAAGERFFYDPADSFLPVYFNGIKTADVRNALFVAEAFSPDSPFAKAALDSSMRSMAAAPAAPAAPPEAGASGGAEASLRANLTPFAHWLAQGETDDQGSLKLSFTLPDNLTSYRLVAIACDGVRFATTKDSIIATKPLQLVGALPRFATLGDAMEARVLVQNMSTRSGSVTVTATGENVELSQNTANITLKPGESGLVRFPASFMQLGTATMVVEGRMGKEQDAVRLSIPVLPAAPLTTVAAADVLREGESATIPIAIPGTLEARSALDVVLAASPAAGLSLVGQELLDYPWDCLEQSLSRAWMRALRLQHGSLVGLPPDPEDRKIIRETLERVSKFQLGDGGFGLWPGMRISSQYLTNYVLLVNKNVAALDLALAPGVQEKAVKFLNAALTQAMSDPKKAPPLDVSAVTLWVLAERGDTNVPLEALTIVLDQAEKSAETTPFTWASLLLANKALAHKGSEKDAATRQQRILAGLEKLATRTPTQLHFASPRSYSPWLTMGSNLRDNALVLAALTRVQPEYVKLDALAYWLGQGLTGKKVLSTQEAIFGVWGLAQYLQSLGTDQPSSMQARFNGETVTKSFQKLIDPAQSWTIPAAKLNALGAGARPELNIQAEYGTAYWTLRFRYAVPGAPLNPENAGLSVTYALSPKEAGDVTGGFTVGSQAQALVTLTVPSTRRHVLLFAPFPAGFEPLYASRADLDADSREYQAPWQFQEVRADGMLLYAENVEPGIYMYTYPLRAATPGSFIQRPVVVEEMYTPEVFGRTTDDRITVAP